MSVSTLSKSFVLFATLLLAASLVPSTAFAGSCEIVEFEIGECDRLDTDGDGVCDKDDNCRFAWNPRQNDTDADTAGNACDFDYDQDKIVSIADYTTLMERFDVGSGSQLYDPLYDCNCDGSIDDRDLNHLDTSFMTEVMYKEDYQALAYEEKQRRKAAREALEQELREQIEAETQE